MSNNNVHISISERQTSTFLGMDNHILLRKEHTDGVVGVLEVSVRPGAGAPRHTNTREALLWYGIEGAIVLETEDGRSTLGPGEAMFLPKGRTHAFTNLSDRPARALLVCFPGGLEEFFLELSGRLATDVPAGPPAPEEATTLVTTAARYGVIVQSPAAV
ncbi:cupin domain-containing protein [Kribbella sp. NPDC023972]|uniref:cupin domain-containing protein n=1 Tax=Kribbella sp. NPDC023972 TaxID=3154795 RepID=UPI0034084149